MGHHRTGGNSATDMSIYMPGRLFTHQLSHIWVDFRDIQDTLHACQGHDYFENRRRATHVQRQYAIDNPLKFAHYGGPKIIVRGCCGG